MAKRPNQRLKLLYLAKIMLRLTDDEHGLQVEQIINELAKYDIAAERKSIYSDFRNSTSACGIYFCITDSWIVGGINETEGESDIL